eukprot:PITA_14337
MCHALTQDGVVLTQDGEGELDHPIAFVSRNFSKAEKNYSMIEHEGLVMVYALQNFRHYLIGKPFKMYTNHSALKYLVNKPMSRIEIGEEPINLEDRLPDAYLFALHIADNHFVDIIHFLTMGTTLEVYTSQQKKELVVCTIEFSAIVGHLYKMSLDEIMQRYVPKFEWNNILPEAYGGDVGGHYVGKAKTQNILRAGLWWPTLHKDFKNYCQIQPLGKKTGAWYIITVTKYLTRWKETQPMKDYIGETTTKFLFEYVMTRFGCLRILMSDHDTHFLNETITALTKEFQVYHQKSMPYHLQTNGMVKVFNMILDNVLMKVCNVQRNDWDVRVPTVLWAYNCKKLIGQTPFRLVYGIEAVMPMEYIVPSLCIAMFIGIVDHGALEERLAQLTELEEDKFLARFHQQVQKERKKSWHDRHIKMHTFKVNNLILLYDNNFDKSPRKFQLHWLGPYVTKEIMMVEQFN